MRFWGIGTSARDIGRRITGLSTGTLLIDQTWYALQRGFEHDFLPQATLEDIKSCIDAGFPVLVYVPAHVFVIFGYDEALGTFVTYDVATADVWVEYVQKDFAKAWKKQGAPLALVYPPEKKGEIPPSIAAGIQRFSNRYIHYHLHYLDAPEGFISVSHLLEAAQPDGRYILPVTALYTSFPHVREHLDSLVNPDTVIAGIFRFFGSDFDEGVHLWGQYHDENAYYPDMALYYAVYYMTAHERYAGIERLLVRIDEMGQLTPGLIFRLGMIDLARGRLRSGMQRLARADLKGGDLYMGLVERKTHGGETAVNRFVSALRAALSDMADANALRPSLRLDSYGTPRAAIANRQLLQIGEYGEAHEALEESWWKWSFLAPFDAPVARELSRLYQRRLAELDEQTDAVQYRETKRRMELSKLKADLYGETGD